MEQALKERLVGATVLVILVVIFLPMLLSDHIKDNDVEESELPTVELTESIEVTPVEVETSSEEEMLELESLELESYGNEGQQQTLSVDNQAEQENNKAITETQDSAKEVEVTEEKVEPVKPQEQTTNTETTDSKQTTSSDANRLREMGLTAYVVQLGTFSSKTNAEGLVKKLKSKDFPAFIEPIRSGDKMLYRVRVGPEVDREDANALLQKLRQEMKIDGTVLEYP